MSVILCITVDRFVYLINKCYPIISSFAILTIVGMLFYALFGKRRNEFTIGVRKEVVIWVTMVCSLIALCRTFPVSSDFDYMGIITSIFSLLVTVLIGWNIYTIIDVKSIRKDFETWKKGIDKEINTYKTDCENKIKENKDYADTKYDEIQKRVNMIDFYGNNAGKILNVTFDSTTKEKLSTMTSLINSFCEKINVSPTLFVKANDRLIYLNGGFADKYIDILVNEIKVNCGLDVSIRFSDLENSDIGVPIKTKDGFKMPNGKPLASSESEFNNP